MIIQINTDNNIKGNEERINAYSALISDSLNRFNGQLSRIEVHLSDENSHKSGQDDIRCLLEARIEGMQPIAVTNFANSQEHALKGALDKIKSALTSTLGKLKN
jgi:hypothetical protein